MEDRGRRKYKLPTKILARVGHTQGVGARHYACSQSSEEIVDVDRLDFDKLGPEGQIQCPWKQRDPILPPLAVTNLNLAALKVQILDPQTVDLADAQSGTIC
jgi:hypothetical protein